MRLHVTCAVSDLYKLLAYHYLSFLKLYLKSTRNQTLHILYCKFLKTSLPELFIIAFRRLMTIRVASTFMLQKLLVVLIIIM